MLSRAIGDVTTLDLTNIEEIKSEGWIELNVQLNDVSGNAALLFLSEIKQFANEKLDGNEELNINVIYQLGIRDLYDQLDMNQKYSDMFTFDLGALKLISEESSQLDIYWRVNWPEYAYNSETDDIYIKGYLGMHFYFNITDPGQDNSEIKFYLNPY